MTEQVRQFALSLDEIPFELVNKKTNEVTKYMIVELPGNLRDEHMDNIRTKMELGKDGKVEGVKSMKGINTSLLARCVYKIEADETRTLVPEATLLSWPAKTLDQLHELASELSGLNKEEDEEGNDSKNE